MATKEEKIIFYAKHMCVQSIMNHIAEEFGEVLKENNKYQREHGHGLTVRTPISETERIHNIASEMNDVEFWFDVLRCKLGITKEDTYDYSNDTTEYWLRKIQD